jgi:DNA-binding NarL/FixJ family response regulator
MTVDANVGRQNTMDDDAPQTNDMGRHPARSRAVGSQFAASPDRNRRATVADCHHTAAQTAITALSQRDLHLLQLLAEGLGDQAIAERLQLQPQTVRKYLMELMSKLGAESRLQALVFALRHGLVTIDRERND